MRCPRCKMEDVYLSKSANSPLFGLIKRNARCHRCCYLFAVPPWINVPTKRPGITCDHEVELGLCMAAQQ